MDDLAVGIESYRDIGGVIKFLPALLDRARHRFRCRVSRVSLWMIPLSLTPHAFMDQYTAAMLAEKQAAGLSGAALEAEIATMERKS